MIKKTKSEILEKVEKAAKDMNSFYTKEFVKYSGRTRDTGEYYTEIVAKYLCEHLDLFDQMQVISRKNSYKKTHDGEYGRQDSSAEVNIAKNMFIQSKDRNVAFEKIGRVIDYQTPLKDTKKDEAGKIDLLSFDGKTARVLELKNANNNETMLRCVLEGYTYLKIIDKEKCAKDFGLPANTCFKTSPLVFIGGVQEKEYKDESRIYLHKLMELLDITPFFLVQTYAVVK